VDADLSKIAEFRRSLASLPKLELSRSRDRSKLRMPKEPKAVKRERTSEIPIPDALSSKKARNQREVNGKGQQTKKAVIEWHLDEIFKEAPEEDAKDEERVVFDPDLSYYGIIILNQPIELRPAYFRDVWANGFTPRPCLANLLTNSRYSGLCRRWSKSFKRI